MRARRTIRSKLISLVLISVGLALLVGTAVGLWQELNRYALEKRESLFSQAAVLASAIALPARRHEALLATQTLRAIGRMPGVLFANLTDAEGESLASLGEVIQLSHEVRLDERTQLDLASLWKLLLGRTVAVSVPVIEAGDRVGTLALISDTADLYSRFRQFVLTSLIGAGLTVAIGFALAIRMQRSITRPLAALTGAMSNIEATHDYSGLVSTDSDDEFGVLATSFNGMMREIRKRDGQLAHTLEHLEEEVSDRTRDLKEAKVAADSANAAKSEFLAVMSHEIRTPMNGMLVMAELLASSELPERQKRYAEVIARSGQSLLAVINDILDFSKVEAGKIDLETIELHVADLVDTTVSLFSERAKSKNLDLAALIDPRVPEKIEGDPVRLGQVLGNLVNNALKFTLDGSVLICVAPVAGGLRFSVKDSGIGIPAERRVMLFQAFAQADSSTTRRFGGTGLGLSISKKLVEAMHGQIGVESVEGQGSTFWFDLPCDSEPETARNGIAAQEGIEVVVAVQGEATRKILIQQLELRGFRVSIQSFDQAIVSTKAITCLFADMSDLSKLRQKPNCATRVVALVPFGEASDDIPSLSDGQLRRPVTQGELRLLLDRLSADEPLEQQGAQRRKTDALPQFHSAVVLVADDSEVNQEVACEALNRLGVRNITLVADGAAAVQAAVKRKFDLILMDGSMPELDGFEASRRIRAHENATGFAPVPIIALTAHVAGSGADAWRDAGMDGVLHKPFSVKKLADCLTTHLDRSVMERPAGAYAEGNREPRSVDGELATALLDSEAIERLQETAASGGGEFVARILGLYQSHAPIVLAELALAAERYDHAGVAAAAHSLKSMSLNMGVSRLALKLSDMEASARDSKLIPSETAVSELRSILELTIESLSQSFPVQQARATA